MKKKYKIAAASVLASAILIPSSYSLYKVCNQLNTFAQKKINLNSSSSKTSNGWTKVGKVKVTVPGEETWYEASCWKNDETNERYSSIENLFFKKQTTTEAWYVPASVEYDGVNYPVTKIDLGGIEALWGETLNLLSFRDACNLEEICEGSFSYEKGRHGPKIHLVDFRGANKLKKIGDWAFNCQWWDSSYAKGDYAACLDFDLSLTQLETIGKRAFNATNQSVVSKNTFNNFYLPPTFKSFGEYCFHYSSGDKNKFLRFNRIYITTPAEDIDTETFFGSNNCLPYVYGKDDTCTKGIIVQSPEQCEKLKNCKNCYQSDGRSISEATYDFSHITLNQKNQSEGSYNIAGQTQYDGADPRLFKVDSIDGFEGITINCEIHTWSDEIKDKIKVIKKQTSPTSELCFNIQWPNGLTPGSYQMVLRAWAVPDDGSAVDYTNLAITKIITLVITEPSLTFSGQTPVFIGSNKEKGRSNGVFTFDYGSQYINYSSLNPANFYYYIVPLSSDWDDRWSIQAEKVLTTNDDEPFTPSDPFPCAISWDLRKDVAGESVGKAFLFKLIGAIETTSGCTIYASKQFSLAISSSTYTVTTRLNTISFDSSETTPKSTEIIYKYGEDGDILKPDFPKLTYVGELGNEAITLKKKDEQTNEAGTITYEMTVDPTKLNQGTYYVWALFLLDTSSPESLGYDYPLHSDIIKITKKGVADVKLPDMVNGSNILKGKKNTCGQDTKAWTFEAEGDTKWQIRPTQGIQFSHANIEAKERSNMLGSTIIDQNTAFYVNWTEEFATNNDWYDLYFTNVTVHLVNETSNEECDVVMPITIASTNVGEVMTSCPTTIDAMPMTEGEGAHSFKLAINDDLSLIDDPHAGETEYSIDFSDGDLHDYQLSLETSPTDEKAVYLKWSNNIPKGRHYFRVTAYNDYYYATATTEPICLNVGSVIELIDVQSLIDTVKGIAGQCPQPISVYLNGRQTQNAEFSLINAPSGITIDNNGVISWDGTTNIGTHSIQLQVSAVDDEGDKITTSSIFTFRVTSQADDPTISSGWKYYAILGGTAAGALGLGIGGTCLISYLKKTKGLHKTKSKK